MGDIVYLSDLRDRGFDTREVSRLQRDNRLRRVRRGAYAWGTPLDPSNEARHRELVLATVPLLADGSVISHRSAAVLHGLPMWPDSLRGIDVTRGRRGGARTRPGTRVHGAPLDDIDVALVDGVAVTSLSRTVLDLGRSLAYEEAVAAGDHALARGLSGETLLATMERMRRWPGMRQARRMVHFLDARSESAGESASRVRMAEAGLLAPELQVDLHDDLGELMGRVDFCWPAWRTVGEFDGRSKYGRLRASGQSVEDVVWAEKRREDRLRDEGWEVVRWTWADLYQPGVVADRIERAFRRQRLRMNLSTPTTRSL